MSIIERLECVHYSGPVPYDSAVLTALCLVFDKIHFPNVYLPKGDYDKELLRQEIERLEQLPANHDARGLIGILKFIEYRLPLDGILEYPTAPDLIFGQNDKHVAKLTRLIYDVNFPPRENFEPMFEGASIKGLPESDESVIYAGEFYYQAGAIAYASQKELPLLDDGSGLALPFRARYKNNASSLAALVALESASIVLPDLPLLRPQEIVDFRSDNVKELQSFRASMLRYGRTLNADIAEGTPAEEVVRKARFLVETEIAPALHDLSRDLSNPNRPWLKRMTDGVRVSSAVFLGLLTGGVLGKTVAEAVDRAVLSELDARGDKLEAAKRSGLYYLLKARAICR